MPTDPLAVPVRLSLIGTELRRVINDHAPAVASGAARTLELALDLADVQDPDERDRSRMEMAADALYYLTELMEDACQATAPLEALEKALYDAARWLLTASVNWAHTESATDPASRLAAAAESVAEQASREAYGALKIAQHVAPEALDVIQSAERAAGR